MLGRISMRGLRLGAWHFSGCWSLVLGCFLLTTSFTAPAQTTAVQMLSGHGKDDGVPWHFMCTTGTNSGIWTNLPVPSQWDIKGFGTLNYHKDQSNAWNEHGLYEHEFVVSNEWAGKRVFLVFDGSMTDTDAKLNGQSAGPLHQGSFYRFKYEVTSLVKVGTTNKLEVDVAKHSANNSVNRTERLADYWVFGGIFRPVYLEAVPQEFIERVAINALADGSFSADLTLNGATNTDEVEAQIQTLDGTNVGDAFHSALATSADTQQLKSQVSAPKLWTAETPNLYRVELRLKRDGKVIHEVTQRFGFRTFEVRDGDGLYLNGQRVILKGADRHSFWPDSGRTLSEAVHRLDINTMKDANMNAVRMSHYPPDEQFLDLCDELGLYVLDEISGWHNHYDDVIGPKLVKEMVVRDVNHPSILFWDNGNEGGFNTNLDRLYDEYDPQNRRVLHPWAAFDGVNTAHYLQYDQAQQAADGVPIYYHSNGKTFAATNSPKTIYMPTEFMHGLYDGGAGAGLDDYWRMMTAGKYLGGGFIWALLDDGVKRPDTGEIDVAGNQAPDGIVGPYRQREGSFYAIKEIWSPIQLKRDKKGVFTVENHFSFTDASDCKFEWEVRGFSSPTEKGTETVLATGSIDSVPKITPGQTGTFKFSPPPVRNADALALRVSDPFGRELWTWVWPLRKDSSHRLAEEPAEHHAIPSETNDVVTVTAGDLTATFSEKTGLLLGVQRGTQKFSLTNGPCLAVGSATLREMHFTDDGPDAVIVANFDGDLKRILWRVNGNGWIQCTYTYLAHGTNDFLGVTFDYPENLVTHKRWYGDGPYRVWKNRLRGVTQGIWENDYNDTLTGFRGWVYPEFKGFFANWHWLQLSTQEGPITVINQGEEKFLQVFTPGFAPPNLTGKAWAPVPKCGLAFLDAIPPIGSKFKEASFSGAQGQPTVLDTELSGSVSFYFGPIP
ncbi:MAG TPA: glycoside hydrolase family 2 TIM barrel-domain containing protein [Verrucomicrobiae bacterium]|nr:glycoside hydrolase family 2 TIM barrel-domain containing protein [Verrucomicrobiae bacterium]